MFQRALPLAAAIGLSLLTAACGDGNGGTAPPTPSLVEKSGGDHQTGTAGAGLAQPFEVRVSDGAGTVIADHPVTWSASAGTLSATDTRTDAQGRARSLLTLPQQSGSVTVIATAQGLPPVSFTATSELPPVRITTEYLPAAREALPYDRTIQLTSGAPGAQLQLSLAAGRLPAGLRLEGVRLVGTPTETGRFPLTLRASDGAGAEGTRELTLDVCAPSAPMAVGEVRTHAATVRGECGIFLPSGAAGERYRVTVARTDQGTNGSDAASVAFLLSGNGVSSGVVAAAAAAAAPQFGEPVSAPAFERNARAWLASRAAHVEHLRASEALVRELGAAAVLRASAPAGAARVAAATLPAKLRLSAGTPTSCGASTEPRLVTAIRLAETDWLAIYQDSAQNAQASGRVTAEEAQRLVDLATTYGKIVIDRYFGGVSDIDGNGKVILFLTPDVSGGTLGRVWSGDFYPKSMCGASNAGELVYLSRRTAAGILEGEAHQGFQVLVHELKHVTSLYQRVMRAANGNIENARSPEFHPVWLEEGSADLASETAARYAWSLQGGPAFGATVGESQQREHDVLTPELLAIPLSFVGMQDALSFQPNSLVTRMQGAPEYAVYATGWLFHRWLGDAYGGAAAGSLADADLFRRMNDRTGASGIAGIEAATGRSWADLVDEFAVAAAANGRGVDVPRAFTSYDFVAAIEMWCFAVDPARFQDSSCSESPNSRPGPPGAFPWPVTTDAQGVSESRGFFDGLLNGSSGPSGVRVYDLVSNGTGAGTEINVEVGSPARIRVVRLR